MGLEAFSLAVDRPLDRIDEARVLSARFEDAPAEAIVEAAARRLFPGTLALVSSFGADSAVLLHMASRVDRALPVIFLDTGKLFDETLAYRDRLVERLGLTGIRTVHPAAPRLAAADPAGELWYYDADRCCLVRKVEPLADALAGFAAWITGRKRHQAETRAHLPVFEAEGDRIKVNPLAGWTRRDVEAYLAAHDLPPHPLVASGFRSIGCLPCTSRVAEGEDDRAGRWRGKPKTECGIHFGLEAQGSGI